MYGADVESNAMSVENSINEVHQLKSSMLVSWVWVLLKLVSIAVFSNSTMTTIIQILNASVTSQPASTITASAVNFIVKF